jgi:transposase
MSEEGRWRRTFRSTSEAFLAAAPELGEAWHLMDRAVARGLARKPRVVPARIGVDEKAAGRGQDYITVVSNIDTGTVEYLADERRQSSLDGFFDKFSAEERTGIAAVAMDMWEPYINSTRDHLEDADQKIVFDRYHLMKYLTGAVDTVRKQENRALVATGDKSLAGSKYLGCTRRRTSLSATGTALPSFVAVT